MIVLEEKLWFLYIPRYLGKIHQCIPRCNYVKSFLFRQKIRMATGSLLFKWTFFLKYAALGFLLDKVYLLTNQSLKMRLKVRVTLYPTTSTNLYKNYTQYLLTFRIEILGILPEKLLLFLPVKLIITRP